MSQGDPLLQPFRVEPADFHAALAELRAVRDEVFVGEQGVPVEVEHDAMDPLCAHVIARLLDGTPIGTARLTPDRHIGRMAVRRQARGTGIGGLLLDTLIGEAKGLGHRVVALHAQSHARGFYEAHGFRVEGDEFVEADIPHVLMVREL